MHSESYQLLNIDPSDLLATLNEINSFCNEAPDNAIAAFFYDHLLKTVAEVNDTQGKLAGDDVNAATLRDSLKPLITELLAVLTMSSRFREGMMAGRG